MSATAYLLPVIIAMSVAAVLDEVVFTVWHATYAHLREHFTTDRSPKIGRLHEYIKRRTVVPDEGPARDALVAQGAKHERTIGLVRWNAHLFFLLWTLLAITALIVDSIKNPENYSTAK
jgi:hypothetical protein